MEQSHTAIISPGGPAEDLAAIKHALKQSYGRPLEAALSSSSSSRSPRASPVRDRDLLPAKRRTPPLARKGEASSPPAAAPRSGGDPLLGIFEGEAMQQQLARATTSLQATQTQLRNLREEFAGLQAPHRQLQLHANADP
jgi:hypothetical protein